MRHGTYSCYNNHGCRRPECRQARRDYDRHWTAKRAGRSQTVGPSGVELAVNCWCEADIVFVPPADVFNGLTGSCGRKDCKPIAA